MQRKVYLSLTTLESAKERWFSALGDVSPLAVEAVPLSEAHGRTLAEPAVAALSSPAFHGAAMDGVAVRAGVCRWHSPPGKIGRQM